MRIVGFLVIVSFFMSCKKEYSCHCNTLDPNQGFTANPAHYEVKERKEEDAMVTCATRYSNSGLATNGINCQVSKK